MKAVIHEFESKQMKKDLPLFTPGDTLRVHIRISEGDKTRVQVFEGVCIARRGSGLRENITVRRTSFGVGMERIFPIHSPVIERIQVVRRGQNRRAKLYYLRGRMGKRARIAEVSRELRNKLEQQEAAQLEAVQAAEQKVQDEEERKAQAAAEAEKAETEAAEAEAAESEATEAESTESEVSDEPPAAAEEPEKSAEPEAAEAEAKEEEEKKE